FKQMEETRARCRYWVWAHLNTTPSRNATTIADPEERHYSRAELPVLANKNPAAAARRAGYGR
ncbi:hypothetical protein, partial [Nocardia abscessus]|uniref:hypothetical protein n=1 Tax=Nocardia abscessus TaxID=120957 RepID=UPI002456D400